MNSFRIDLRGMVRSAIALAAVACADPGTPSLPETDPASLVVWHNHEARGEAIPVFDDSTVFHLQQEVHVVYAVNRKTGALRWKRVLPVTLPESDGHGLALAGGVLAVGDIDLFGLDPASGQILWTYHPSQGKYPGFGALTAKGGTVYCGSATGHLYAVDGTTGAELWATQAFPSPTLVFSPAVVDGVVYAGVTNEVNTASQSGGVAVDATTGKVLWTTLLPLDSPTGSSYNTSALAITPTLAVVGDNVRVYGLDRATGALKITVPSSTVGGTGSHVVAYDGSRVIVGSSNVGALSALDPTDLHRLWYVVNEVGSYYAIAVDATHVYASRIGSFQVYRSSDGVRQWKLTGAQIGFPDETYFTSPSVDATTIYLPTNLGVHAFKKE